MRDQIKNRLSEISKNVEFGAYGDDAKQSALEYASISGQNIETVLKAVNDFYLNQKKMSEEFLPIVEGFFEILLTIFIKAHKKDPEVAEYFVSSFLNDLPETEGTMLFHKLQDFVDTSHAFKNSSHSKDRIALWEVAKKLTLNYNEYFNALLGVLLVLIRCALGLASKTTIAKARYGSKIHKFEGLVKNHNLPYELITKFTNSHLRNSIAHGTIWLNSEEAIVNYSDRNRDETMALAMFMALNGSSTYLAEAYMAAISTIVVFMIGEKGHKARLPLELLDLLSRIGK